MPVVRETVHSSLPVEAVFDYVANFENTEEWDPGVVSSQKLTEGPLAVGTEYRVVVQYGGAPQEMTYRVTEVERPHVVVLEGDSSRTRALDTIRFASSGDGAMVDYEADIRLKGVFKAATPFLGRLFAQIGDGARDGLKDRLAELASRREP